MTSKELQKYIGYKVSFDINDAAYLPLPKVEGEDLRDNNHHLEGVLLNNNGSRSHFSIILENGDSCGIRDADIPYIENFKVLENCHEKELTPLQALTYFVESLKHCKLISTGENKVIKIIETALKEKEQQDNALKTLKEVIAFAKKLPDIEFDDNGNIQGIFGAVGMRVQRQMENKERELLRKWMLETCFPKELKALEIIKSKRVNVRCLMSGWSLGKYNSYKTHIELTQEEYDLLKEALK